MSKRLVSFLLAFIMIVCSFTPVFADGIIISGGSEYKIVGENNSEELKSSITINNQNDKDKKQIETPSSLVMDNNNTEEEDKVEVSKEKKPEAQKADENVPPAKDFNEEITEFKQYVRNVTEGQPDSNFVEKLDFHQIPDKVNKIEHKFTLKTRPLSRDYKAGELKIDLTGIEKTREYLDSENNMVGCKITEKNIISNNSEFFSRTTDKINAHSEDALFKYCTELTNKAAFKRGETIDISYTYQEYVNDFYLKNNSTVKVNTFVNDQSVSESPLITYRSNRADNSHYPYIDSSSYDNINFYADTHLGEEYGISGKDYRVIDLGINPYNGSDSIDKTRDYILPISSERRLLADLDPYPNYKKDTIKTQDFNNARTSRTLMLNTPLNGIYPKLVLTSNKDLIYLRADGTVEKYKAGSEIVLVENGKVVRRLGTRQDTLEKEKKNIGILFVERNNKSSIYINSADIYFKLKNTYFKDENKRIPEKVVKKISVDIWAKLPPNQEPKICGVEGRTGLAMSEQYLSYKDLFSGVKTLFSPEDDSQIDYRFRLEYENLTKLETDNAPKVIKILEVVYNKTNPAENYVYEAKNFDTYCGEKINKFAGKSYTAGAYRINFDGIEELYKKLNPDDYLKKNYSAKRIYVVEDTGGENGKPFFKNIKTVDNYDKLPQEIKKSLNELIDSLREKEGIAVYQLEDTISQVPLLHFSGGRTPSLSIINGYKLGDQFIFNSQKSNYLAFSIFQNILAEKDNNLEMTFDITLPEGVTYIGSPRLIAGTGKNWTNWVKIKPCVKNIDEKSIISITLSGKEIKEINKEKVNKDISTDVLWQNSSILRLELPGQFVVDRKLVNNFSGYISWGKDCTIKTTVKTSIKNLEIFTHNASGYNTFESHIAKPSNTIKTNDGKFVFTYTGTNLYEPATTLDYNLSQNIQYEKSPEFIAGISNSVKGPEDQNFTIAPRLINFEDLYKNKITVQTASTPMTDVVIYNDIENANPEFLSWKGTLKNIDLSEFTNQGFVVETYINRAKHSKNIKEDGWEKYNGSENLSDVKSLAFKIMDKNGKPGVLPKESEYSIILKMQAPSEDKVPKVDGKPTHSYSKVFTDWRSVNDNTMSGAESFTVRVSMVGSITDDIVAKVNHTINVNRTYADGITDKEKEENNIVILTDVKTGNKYITSGNTIACVEPGKYSVTYITKKGIKAEGDKTIEIIEQYKDSVNTINVNYKLDDSGSNDGPGYVDDDSKENLFKMTVKNKDKKIIHIN